MTLRAVPKHPKPLVSKALRQSARGQRCSLRWACDGTDVVLCHIRGVWSGVAQKPADTMAIYGCSGCNRAMEGADRPPAAELLRALAETHAVMIAEGLVTVKGAR